MKRNWVKEKHVIWWVLFICYLVGISYFLFFSERYGRAEGTSEYRYNLTLFREIQRFLKYQQTIGLEGFIVNLYGNILAFMPFGFCLPMISHIDRKLHRIIFWSFVFSLTIESIQLVYKIGIFDVDDLLLNTIGGICGYWCFCIIRLLQRHGGMKRATKKKYH